MNITEEIIGVSETIVDIWHPILSMRGQIA